VKIFGIDPGLRNTGWGIIILNGHNLKYCDDGIIKPDPALSDDRRLHHIATEIDTLIEKHQPDLVCIEDVFIAKNPSSALKLGMARGAALISIAHHDIPLVMIAARRAKQNITGSGRADKGQITAMVSQLLGVTPKGADSADALAVAIAGMNDYTGTATPESQDGEAVQPGLASAIEKALAKEESQ
jgi:crossover junction endodeoxyribonuclease RuvC